MDNQIVPQEIMLVGGAAHEVRRAGSQRTAAAHLRGCSSRNHRLQHTSRPRHVRQRPVSRGQGWGQELAYQQPRAAQEVRLALRAVAVIVGAAIALELLYDLAAFIYTGIALGFSHAFLPWHAQVLLRLIGVM